MATFYNKLQSNILADRYLETMLADWKGTLLLIIQAPILAFLAVMVWGNIGKATESMFFVMVLSSLWLGCINASREIVKERPLFLREKMANLNVASYLYSKVYVLGLLCTVQIFLYTMIVWKYVDVKVPVGWLGIVLLFTAMCGTCLGLLISSLVKRSDYAVALVPLVIIPQLVFSEFAIAEDQFEGASEVVFKLMPTRWGYESLLRFGETDIKYFEGLAHILPLITFGILFLIIAYPILRSQKY